MATAETVAPPPGFVDDLAPPEGFVEDAAPPPGFELDQPRGATAASADSSPAGVGSIPTPATGMGDVQAAQPAIVEQAAQERERIASLPPWAPERIRATESLSELQALETEAQRRPLAEIPKLKPDAMMGAGAPINALISTAESQLTPENAQMLAGAPVGVATGLMKPVLAYFATTMGKEAIESLKGAYEAVQAGDLGTAGERLASAGVMGLFTAGAAKGMGDQRPIGGRLAEEAASAEATRLTQEAKLSETQRQTDAELDSALSEAQQMAQQPPIPNAEQIHQAAQPDVPVLDAEGAPTGERQVPAAEGGAGVSTRGQGAPLRTEGVTAQAGISEGPGAAAATEPLVSYEKRRFGERFQEDKTIDPAIREATGNQYYEPIPNVATVKEAEAIIERRGTDEGVRLVRDESFPMDHRVRSTMAQGLIKKLNQSYSEATKAGDTKAAEGFLGQAVDTAEYLSELGTKLGQGVQSFAIWSRLTPEGMLMAAERQIKKVRTRIKTESGKDVESIIKSADDSGGGAAKKAETKNANLIEGEANRIAKILSDTPTFKTSKPNEVLALIRKHLKEPQERFAERLVEYGAGDDLAASIDRMATENRRRIQLARTVEELGRPEREAVQIAESMARDLSDTPSLSEKRTSEVRKLITQHSTKGVGDFAIKMKELGVRDTALVDRIDRIAAENRRRVEVIDRVRATERREKEFQRTADRIAQQLSDTPVWAKKGTRNAAQELIREHLKEEQADFVSRLIKFGADRKTAESIDRMSGENRKRVVAVERAERSERLRKQYSKTPLGKKLPRPLWEKIVELSDAGLLNEEAFYTLAADRLGLPKYDKATVAELTRMAAEIEATPEGFQRNEKMTEFLGKIADLKGVDPADIPTALWYANILSGYSTQLVNTVDTGLNVFSEAAAMAASHPTAVPDIISGLYRGMLKGGLEAKEALKTGRGRTENKLQIYPVLERARFGEAGGVPVSAETAFGRVLKAGLEKKPAKILNLWKYPLRAMVASDTVFYNSFKEARSRVLARVMAKKEGLSGDALFQRVDEILNQTPEKIAAAEQQAQAEGLTGARYKRRVREIQEQGRPEELVSNADEAAQIATYNHDPTGTLGVIAAKIGEITQNVPLARAIVPFTRIVANVANRGLDYTPWGYKRLFFGQHGGERFATKPPVGEAYRAQLVKATAGTIGMTALAALDAADVIQVTASGPQNPDERKQMQNAGWKPYSVKMGDTWVSYQYTPLNLGLAMVGHYRDAIRYNKLDEKDAQTRLAYGMLKAGSTLFDMSFLSGLSSFMETMSGATSSSKAAGRMLARTASSVVVPNLFKQIDRLFDPTLYDAPTVQQMLIRETPVARSLALEPMLNVLGEPIKLSNNRFFAFDKDDPVWKLIVEKQAFVPVPSKTRKVGKRPITPKEYRELIEVSGKEIRSYIQGNLGSLRSATPEEAQKLVNAAATKSRDAAMKRFSEKSPKS